MIVTSGMSDQKESKGGSISRVHTYKNIFGNNAYNIGNLGYGRVWSIRQDLYWFDHGCFSGNTGNFIDLVYIYTGKKAQVNEWSKNHEISFQR